MGLFDKAKNLGSKTMEEGKKYAEITKINVTISSYEEEIREYKLIIGDIVAEAGVDKFRDQPEILEQLTKIGEIKLMIMALQDRINDIRNVNVCQGCGTEVAKDEKFCGQCGRPMVIIETVETPKADETVCNECGARLTAETLFCTNCGKQII